MRALLLHLVVTGAVGVSCAGPDIPPLPGPEAQAPLRLPPLASAATTVDKRLAPAHPIEPNPKNNPALVENQKMYLDAGFGELQSVPGEPFVARTLDGAPAPQPGPNRRRLVRFVHLADVHVVDDESPARFGSFDLPQPTTSALRPQDPDSCRMVNAAVRTINALHRQEPLAFTLMGGDNIDNMQGNELDWFLSILDGSQGTRCDSGEPSDPVAGSGNDGKDSFVAEGLAMPWHWVTGNHDVLVQGFMTYTADLAAMAIGSDAAGGTRNYRQGGAVQEGDFVVPDPRRALGQRGAMLQKVHASGDGHGIGDAQLASGKAFYSFDVKDTPLRFVILDTGSESGGDGGMLHRLDVQAHVTPLLEEARTQGKWVVLAAHHAVDTLSADGGPTGTTQADAMLPDEWKSYLDKYPIAFSMNAHYHRYGVGAVKLPSGRQYWEVLTSALADFPHGFRVVEIWDEDNGYLMLRATCIDLNVDGDDVARQGRALGVVDLTSGFQPDDGRGKLEDRNVELYVPKP